MGACCSSEDPAPLKLDHSNIKSTLVVAQAKKLVDEPPTVTNVTVQNDEYEKALRSNKVSFDRGPC